MKTLLVLALALGVGCASAQDWKPVVGEAYSVTRQKLDGGTAFISIEGDEVRWWLEDPRTAQHWLYYARFDGPVDRRLVVIRINQVTGETQLVSDEPSKARLVEFAWNTRAYDALQVSKP